MRALIVHSTDANGNSRVTKLVRDTYDKFRWQYDPTVKTVTVHNEDQEICLIVAGVEKVEYNSNYQRQEDDKDIPF